MPGPSRANLPLSVFRRLVSPIERHTTVRRLGRHPLVQRAYFALWDRIAHGEATVDTPHGQITVDLADRYVGRPLFMTSVYEAGVSAVLRRFVRPGLVAADIGAHVGYHTLLLARLTERVYAFEPEPHNRNLLTGNVLQNGVRNVVVIPRAVGRANGTATLHLSTINHGGHSLVGDRDGLITVPVTTLQSAIGRDAGRLGFVKMDIEGAELDALHGMAPLLRSAKPTMVVEFWPSGLREAGHVPMELPAMLRSLGYYLRAINEWTGETTPADDAELRRLDARRDVRCFTNLLAVM